MNAPRDPDWYINHVGGVAYVGLEESRALLNIEHLARRVVDAANGFSQGVLFDRINDLDVALWELDEVLARERTEAVRFGLQTLEGHVP